MALRLNIGCNKIYRPGFVNIDEQKGGVADVVASPCRLPFEDNSVDSIESYHYIESMGYEKVIMAIGEWFRILKPNGVLIIETINTDPAFAAYVKADDLVIKDQNLTMLYEAERDNLKRISAFFFWKLNALVEDVGFNRIEEDNSKLKYYPASFRLVCRKPEECLGNMVIQKAKSLAVNNIGLLGIQNYSTFREFNGSIYDVFVKTVVSKIEFEPLTNSEDFFTIVAYSPKAALYLLSVLHENGLAGTELFNHFSFVLNELISAKFVKTVYKQYFAYHKEPGPAIDYYITVLQENNSFLSGLFGLPGDSVPRMIQDRISEFNQYKVELPANIDEEVFSHEHIKTVSETIQLNGIKLAMKKDFQSAYKLFIQAARLNPELYNCYANLGLIEAYAKKYEKALTYFEQAGKIVERGSIKLYTAMCYLYLNRLDDSVNLANEVEEDSFEKYTLLGAALYSMENYVEAYEAFSWAVILTKLPVAYVNLGLVCNKMDRSKQAQHNFTLAKGLNPQIEIPTTPFMPPFKPLPFSTGDLF